MQVESLAIEDVKLLRLRPFEDERGFFAETWNRRVFEAAGIACSFVQDNHSLTRAPGTVRGLHFQTPPFQQDKLLRVIRGAIFDVAVDLRAGSPTRGRHVTHVLRAGDWTHLFVPVGFAHGFCTIEPDTEVLYKVSGFYSPQHDKGVLWDDPELGIAWPVAPGKALLSPKDRALPRFSELPPDLF